MVNESEPDKNNRVAELLRSKPLLKFSAYTQNQMDTLLWLADEIRKALDTFDGSLFHRQYSLFWLWVLGAFEVVRTMHAARECFTDEFWRKLDSLKKDLVPLRMAFTKQKYAGKKQPIKNEASVSGFDEQNKDLQFDVNGHVFSVRGLVYRFESVLRGVKFDDVLCDHRES